MPLGLLLTCFLVELIDAVAVHRGLGAMRDDMLVGDARKPSAELRVLKAAGTRLK
jgi:hypothetical protein